MSKLKISVERIDGYCNQPMLVGDHFFVEGGKITIPDGKHICMWALQSMMPIFPVMQRESGEKETGPPGSRARSSSVPTQKGKCIIK